MKLSRRQEKFFKAKEGALFDLWLGFGKETYYSIYMGADAKTRRARLYWLVRAKFCQVIAEFLYLILPQNH